MGCGSMSKQAARYSPAEPGMSSSLVQYQPPEEPGAGRGGGQSAATGLQQTEEPLVSKTEVGQCAILLNRLAEHCRTLSKNEKHPDRSVGLKLLADDATEEAQRLIKWLDAPMASDPLRDLPRLASELLTTLKPALEDAEKRGVRAGRKPRKKALALPPSAAPTDALAVLDQAADMLALPDICVGSDVVISGLQGAKEYNGKRGKVEEFADGRWVVTVSGGKQIRVRPENLSLVY